MEVYLYIFLIVLFGFVSGGITALGFKRQRHKKECNKKKHRFLLKSIFKKHKRNEVNNAPSKKNSVVLEEKLRKDDMSLLSFNCAADNVSVNDYVRKLQNREDNAYNILKRRKK